MALRTFEHKDRRGRRSKEAPDLNISKLSEAAGLSPGHFNHVLAGRRRPGREFLFKLAKLRGQSVEEVYEWIKDLSQKKL